MYTEAEEFCLGVAYISLVTWLDTTVYLQL